MDHEANARASDDSTTRQKLPIIEHMGETQGISREEGNDRVDKSPIGHSSLQERKAFGAHYTPTKLAKFVAKHIVTAWTDHCSKEPSSLLDPAVGDGELLVSAIEALQQEGHKRTEIAGFDTDDNAVEFSASRIASNFPDIDATIKNRDFLQFSMLFSNEDMFHPPASEAFDLVIANPPYVRTQVLGSKRAQKLTKQFGLSGRVDLYHAFILGITAVLRKGGVAGIITSNRFMTTKAGSVVRQHLRESFDILHVWDLGDTKLFEAAVLPAVLLLRKKDKRGVDASPMFTSIYTTDEPADADAPYENVLDTLESEGVVAINDGRRFRVQQGKLYSPGELDSVWRLSNGEIDEWLARVEQRSYCTFGDVGKIRVGVKTNANKVFIRSDWHELPEDERPCHLCPVITHHVARPFRSHPLDEKKKILYPHEVKDGKRGAIDLEKHPQTAKYLERHRDVLERRDYLIKSNREWFEIWVPQDPDAWAGPKVVFRDISENPTFWMDRSGAIVNGDCYWLKCDEDEGSDLLWLVLAVGNSSFTRAFYDRKFNNKLYAGRRRFMTQYVEKFPVPHPEDSAAKEIIKLTKRYFGELEYSRDKSVEARINQLVWRSFGLPVEETLR